MPYTGFSPLPLSVLPPFLPSEDYLQFALGMLSGYLPRAEAVALQGHLG